MLAFLGPRLHLKMCISASGFLAFMVRSHSKRRRTLADMKVRRMVIRFSSGLS